jgi:thioredoxin reductase/pSer/pThr/pTyr-binding forkhead associated (FHA) protein/NAD-dependent dihydropyrimidine dehydrogenase PreA subunit
VDLAVNGVPLKVSSGLTSARLSPQDRFRIGQTEVEVQLCTVRLIAVAGERSGRELVLGDDLVSMGRAPDNTIDFEDSDVSVYHAVVRCTAQGFMLEDQGSTNGVWVNGKKVPTHLLADGDSFHIGRTEFRFLVDSELTTESEYDWSGPEQSDSDQQVLARLVFLAGTRAGEEFELSEDQQMIGRRPSCFVTLSDLRISGIHFGITKIDSQYHITDLQSANGTLLNNKRLTETKLLRTGDLISVGDSIAEFRVAGGIAPIDGGVTLIGDLDSVMASGAHVIGGNPKFVVGGAVESIAVLEIGSSPQANLFVEKDPQVESVHCRISYQEGFKIEDCSKGGTYLNDQRIVKEDLLSGQVIRVGQTLIDVSIRGERCTLDIIDKAMARAAVQVARENAFDLGQAQIDEKETRTGSSAYRTMFSMDVPNVDAMVKERKESFHQGAPAWRPSSDLQRNPLVRPMVAIGVIASLALLVGVFITDRSGNLTNHPLSEVHSSKRFVSTAETLGLPSDCRACHTDGAKNGSVVTCTNCHEGFDATREAHASVGAAGDKSRHGPGSDCTRCHSEHKAQARATGDEPPNLLGASTNCSSSGCHVNPHGDQDFSSPDMRLLEGPKLSTFSLSQRDLHIKHAVLPPDDKGNELGCRACHGGADASGNLTEEEADPGKACFRCHTAPEGQSLDGQCLSCHEQEHAIAANLLRLDPGDPLLEPASPPPTIGRSTVFAGSYLGLLFAPILLVALVRYSRRKKDAERLVKKLNEYPVETIKRMIHSINVDKCVGCRMCVQACPASVLELVNHKSVVVNFDACIQCKRCEQACAFDALRMHDADKPPPSIKVPDVDAWYQTSIKGMYLIGQVAGTPQIKNASNVGTAVVHHAKAHGLAPGIGQSLGASYDVIIAGSGPAGLSAALACVQQGLSYIVLEKQREFSWTIRNYYHKGKPVMAEPNKVEMLGLLQHWDTNREELLAHWQKQVGEANMQIAYQQDVTQVQKTGEFFTVSVSDPQGNVVNNYTSARVILAIGTMGNPRKLGCPGEDMVKVRNSLVDPDEFQGQNVLVVGGTDSAIEVVMALKDTNKVWLSCRSARFDRVKPKNLELIMAAIDSGQVTALWSTAVKGVDETSVTVENRTNKERTTVPNDVVFAMIGGHPPVKFLEGIGVPYIERPHSWSPPRSDELVNQSYALR